jgi:polyisoprenoid-binding protein YceI
MRRFLLLSLLLTTPVLAAAYTLSGTPRVAFHAAGSPGFLDIEGVTSALEARDDGSTLSFVVGLDSVSTGISLRDQHMKNEYAQTAQFPEATLTLPRSAVQWPASQGESTTGVAAATFTAHGVSRPTDVRYTLKRGRAGTHVNADFALDVRRHGIAIPSYLGITVDPKMTATVSFDLADAP